MKTLLTLALLGLTSCAGRHTIENVNSHEFYDDSTFIESTLECDNVYQTDEFNSVDNEVFRCSADNSNIFLTLESNGNNSEHLKSVTLIWKQWRSELDYQESKIKAQQFIAVLARMYAGDKQLELVDAFFNKEPSQFDSITYKIITSSKTKQFYTIRKAVVTFK